MCFSPGIKIAGSRYGIRLDQLTLYLISGFILYYFSFTLLIKKEFEVLPLGSFLFYTITTYFFTSDYLLGLSHFLSIFRFTLYCIFGYLIINSICTFKIFYNWLVLIGLFIIFASLLQIFQVGNIGNFFFNYYKSGGGNSAINYLKLPTSFFGNSEFTARFTALIFLLVLSKYYLSKNIYNKLIYLIVLIMPLIVIIKSEARGLIYSVYIVSLSFLLLRNAKYIIFLYVVLFLSLIVISFIYFDDIYHAIKPFDKNFTYRLEKTWIEPIFANNGNILLILFGNGLHNSFGDGSYTARFGYSGLIGSLIFYFPIFYFLIKNCNKNNSILKFYNVYLFLLIISNITYQSFETSRQGDLFWLIFGCFYKYSILLSKKRYV